MTSKPKPTLKEMQTKMLEWAAELKKEREKIPMWEREATLEDATKIFNGDGEKLPF